MVKEKRIFILNAIVFLVKIVFIYMITRDLYEDLKEIIIYTELVLIIFAYVFWILVIRDIKFWITSINPNTIVIPEEIGDRELFYYLDTHLTYPDLKRIFYNSEGQIVISCKYGSYVVERLENKIYISVDSNIGDMGDYEEAECLSQNIIEIFEPERKISFFKYCSQMIQLYSYKKQKSRMWKILILAIVVSTILNMNSSGEFDYWKSAHISEHRMLEYSDSITLGSAFRNFFSEPEWKRYKIGLQEYVDFKGNCLSEDGEEMRVIITFIPGEDEASIESITVNEEEIFDFRMLFEAIFNNYD